jgi:hypothetical protein
LPSTACYNSMPSNWCGFIFYFNATQPPTLPVDPPMMTTTSSTFRPSATPPPMLYVATSHTFEHLLCPPSFFNLPTSHKPLLTSAVSSFIPLAPTLQPLHVAPADECKRRLCRSLTSTQATSDTPMSHCSLHVHLTLLIFQTFYVQALNAHDAASLRVPTASPALIDPDAASLRVPNKSHPTRKFLHHGQPSPDCGEGVLIPPSRYPKG